MLLPYFWPTLPLSKKLARTVFLLEPSSFPRRGAARRSKIRNADVNPLKNRLVLLLTGGGFFYVFLIVIIFVRALLPFYFSFLVSKGEVYLTRK